MSDVVRAKRARSSRGLGILWAKTTWRGAHASSGTIIGVVFLAALVGAWFVTVPRQVRVEDSQVLPGLSYEITPGRLWDLLTLANLKSITGTTNGIAYSLSAERLDTDRRRARFPLARRWPVTLTAFTLSGVNVDASLVQESPRVVTASSVTPRQRRLTSPVPHAADPIELVWAPEVVDLSIRRFVVKSGPSDAVVIDLEDAEIHIRHPFLNPAQPAVHLALFGSGTAKVRRALLGHYRVERLDSAITIENGHFILDEPKFSCGGVEMHSAKRVEIDLTGQDVQPTVSPITPISYGVLSNEASILKSLSERCR